MRLQHILLPLTITTLCQAATIHVPGDAVSIQQAFDASSEGDTIQLSADVYHEHGLDWPAHNLHLQGVEGQTVIDADRLDRCLLVDGSEVSNATIDGIIFRNGLLTGTPNAGGGIGVVSGARLEVSNCSFESCEVVETVQWYGMGGGIGVLSASVSVSDVTFSDCAAERYGGAFGFHYGFAELERCIFDGNRVTAGNQWGYAGMAMYSTEGGTAVDPQQYDTLRVSDSIFRNHHADDSALIYLDMGRVVLDNCLIENNSSYTLASFSSSGCGVVVRRSTITNNDTYAPIFDGWNIFMDSSICWNQGCCGYYAPYYYEIVAQNTCHVNYSCLGADWYGRETGNVYADPLFVDVNSRDYRLTMESPCIDAGNPAWSDEDGSRCDMGCFSFIEEDVAAAEERPEAFGLQKAFPNPFNPVTNISWSLPATAHAELLVFNLVGSQVAVLHDGLAEAGEHISHFNGSRLPSGMYLVQLRSENLQDVSRVLLVK